MNKEHKEEGFDVEKYIFHNIVKPWWSEYYKNPEFEVRSLDNQRENILNQIKKVCIDPCDYYKKNSKNLKKNKS